MFLDEVLDFVDSFFKHADCDGHKGQGESFAKAHVHEVIVFSGLHRRPPFAS